MRLLKYLYWFMDISFGIMGFIMLENDWNFFGFCMIMMAIIGMILYTDIMDNNPRTVKEEQLKD